MLALGLSWLVLIVAETLGLMKVHGRGANATDSGVVAVGTCVMLAGYWGTWVPEPGARAGGLRGGAAHAISMRSSREARRRTQKSVAMNGHMTTSSMVATAAA